MGMNVFDRNAGFATGQEQVWGFDKSTGIDSKSYLAPGAKIFYVDPNNPQATDPGNLGEDPTVPLATVQAAVNLCRDHHGDTIVVGANDAWVYAPGNRPIQIEESVVVPPTRGGIRIVGAAPTPWGVQWQAADDNEAALTVGAIDVLVEGFVFAEVLHNNTTGILVLYGPGGASGDNAVIRNCVFYQLDYGIALDFAWYNQIYNCFFESCAEAAIANLDVAGNTQRNYIHDNQFRFNATALLLDVSDNNFIYRNRFTVANPASGNPDMIGTDAATVDNQFSENFLSCTIAQAAVQAPKRAGDFWIFNHATDGAY